MGHISLLLQTIVLLFSFAELTSGSGSTDSAGIRAIESEVRRVKTTTDGILTESKKQKDATVALQNEFKWLHNELKVLKKAIADVDLLANRTNGDTLFIRDKVSDIGQIIQKLVTPVVEKNTTSTTTTTTTPSSVSIKKFLLF